MLRGFIFTISLGLLSLAQLPAQAPPSESDRLIATAKLWFTAKYFSPQLTHSGIDWDQAIVSALPKIRTASTQSEYQVAIETLVKSLPTDSSPAPQRSLIYHGLPPEDGSSPEFYSAFLTKSSSLQESLNIPMGGFTIPIRLSEPLTPAPPTPAKPLTTDPYPSTELRILAAYKIWGIFHYFFAYRDLMDEDWDTLLPTYLQRLISAKDALEYNLAISEWLTHTTDSLVHASSPTLTSYFGEAPLGLTLRIAEKHVVIAAVSDPAATTVGVKPGDIIKTLNGQTLLDRFKTLAQYVPASTTQRLGVDVVNLILNGPEASTASLTIEDPLGNRKDVTLKRSKQFAATPTPNADPARLLAGNIAYLDLTRLNLPQALAALEKFIACPALILDMRGIPANLTASDLAQLAGHFTSEHDLQATIVTGPWVTTPDLPRPGFTNPSSNYFFFQTIETQPRLFKGKTVMLIDERTIGPGELAGLFLQAANKTEFIGSPSAGAYSNLTNFSVPGAIRITLSGQDIRQANGGKLQRLGLQPNLVAAPTAKGISSRKDETLEKALAYLAPKRPPAPSRSAE